MSGRKILRKIFGPYKQADDPSRILTNDELDKLSQRKIYYDRLNKERWLGIERMGKRN